MAVKIEECFYTCEHHDYTAYITPEDSANQCDPSSLEEDESCVIYSIDLCKECSDISWKETLSTPEKSLYKGEMLISGLYDLRYLSETATSCSHLI